MKLKYFFGTLALFIIISSCKKEFLDPKPTDRLAETIVWTSPSLIEAAANSLYYDLSFGIYNLGGIGDDNQMLAAICDETASVYEGYEGRNVLTNGQLNPDNVTTHRMTRLGWKEQFGYVKLANEFLEKMATVTVLSESEKDRLIAEAKTLRAYHYFNLLKMFGGVPLFEKPFKLVDDFYSVSRATIEETIAFILKDINEVLTILPENASVKGRVDRGVAQALKSRILLYATSPLYNNNVNDPAKWMEAADAAKELIDAGRYSLEMDHEKYRKMFYIYDASSPEIIFAREYTINSLPEYGSSQLNTALSHGTTGAGGLAYFTPIQQMVDAYPMTNGKMIDEPGSGYNPQKPYENRDPRFSLFVYYHGSKLNNRTLDFRSPDGFDMQQGAYGNPTGYCMRKFVNEAWFNDQATAIIGPFFNPLPWIHMRYAEILLNYAEAINEAEGPAKAYEPINLIRQRAGIGDLPEGLSQSAMRDKVRNERRIELAFEEHRFHDVRRWMIAEQTENISLKKIKITGAAGSELYEIAPAEGIDITVNRIFLPHQYFWPIMRSEIMINPNIQQNPGYN